MPARSEGTRRSHQPPAFHSPTPGLSVVTWPKTDCCNEHAASTVSSNANGDRGEGRADSASLSPADQAVLHVQKAGYGLKGRRFIGPTSAQRPSHCQLRRERRGPSLGGIDGSKRERRQVPFYTPDRRRRSVTAIVLVPRNACKQASMPRTS